MTDLAATTDPATRAEPASTAAPDLDVVVLGGAGHVGLPLSLTLADSGARVGIFDRDAAKLERLAAGAMPFLETGADELLARVLETDRLEFATEAAMCARADVVLVVVGTPVDEFLGPSMAPFEESVDEIVPHLRPGTLIILRSTVFPGTTAYVKERFREHGADVEVAFCPERIAEGKALDELRSLPQIIGADEPASGDRAEAVFARFATRFIRTSTREAELAKLMTNTWRYMKFAIANQFLMIAQQAGVDYANVLHAVRDGYPRAADLPGPGFAAGPCLFKDTMQLAAFTTDHFPLGQAAVQVNEGLPGFIVDRMRLRYGDLAGRRIGILGMAFKADSDDPRASLSYKLRKLLIWAGATVLATDPYVADDRLVSLDSVLTGSEILVLGAPHAAYRSLEVRGRDVVDVWGAMGGGIQL